MLSRLGFGNISPVVRALLLLWLFEILIVLPLALFIVQAGAHLSAVLRLTIRVLQAPVPHLEVASFGIPTLTIVNLIWMLVMVVIWVLIVGCDVVMRREAFTHVVVRVGDLASVTFIKVLAVLVRETLGVTEDFIEDFIMEVRGEFTLIWQFSVIVCLVTFIRWLVLLLEVMVVHGIILVVLI